jgi:hypothetical protein
MWRLNYAHGETNILMKRRLHVVVRPSYALLHQESCLFAALPNCKGFFPSAVSLTVLFLLSLCDYYSLPFWATCYL